MTITEFLLLRITEDETMSELFPKAKRAIVEMACRFDVVAPPATSSL